MNKPTFLILGGCGNTGRCLARLLLQETDVCLKLSSRSIDKANRFADEINRRYAGNRVTSVYADAADAASLKQAFQGVDMVVVASSTAKYAREVAAAALEAGVDYLDVQYSTKKIKELKSLAADIEKAGRCFITDGGFHPGLPAALVHYAAQHFDTLESANVGSVIKEDWASLVLPENTTNELLEEINDFQMLVFKEGKWKNIGMFGMMIPPSMDFGGEFGKQYCSPMFLEEMRSIPDMYPSLKETGFFVGGFNWFVDWLVMPVALIALKLWPQSALKPMGKLMKWGLITFSKSPYATILKVEARGIKDGKAKALDVTISHKDGYLFTAIPVVACLLQYINGTIRKPGLWTQAIIVEPNQLMKDIARMGIEFTVRV